MKPVLSTSVGLLSIAAIGVGSAHSILPVTADVASPPDTKPPESNVEVAPTDEANEDMLQPSIDIPTFMATLLTVEDLNDSEPIDYLGDNWTSDPLRMRIAVLGEESTLGGRAELCPTSDHFDQPAAWASMDFFHETDGFGAGYLLETVMVFEQSDAADTWFEAYESCVGKHWECCDDPTEYITMESFEVADIGIETAGFRRLYAHEEGGEIEHDEADSFVRLSPTLLVVVHLYSDEEVAPVVYDPTIHDDLTAVVIEKVVAVLCTAEPQLECAA